jgi:septum formation protein
MDQKPPSILLVSQSPRRREILEKFGFQVKVQIPSSSIQEANLGEPGLETPEKLVCENARRKAESIASPFQEWVLSSDTIVIWSAKQYGKPRGKNEAIRFLRELSGKTHEVFSSYFLRKGKREWLGWDVSQVTFKSLTRPEILNYIQKVEVMDKAGAYAIQNGGEEIVSGLQGSFYNVMGLPIEKILEVIRNGEQEARKKSENR